jgi:LmbE family N-acetylglucosaminyl deacetylase
MDNPTGLGFEPEAYVDITPVMELKRQMLRQHHSQDAWIRAIYDDASITDMMDRNAAIRGAAAGVGFAEGFREVKTYPRTGSFALLPGFGA